MNIKWILATFCCLITVASSAQQIQQLTTGTKTHIRGLSVVSDKVVWVSGSNGTVGLSTDGGKNWKWMKPVGHEKRDFRDIEAFDDKTAIIIAVDTPAIILKTVNGGFTWRVAYENKEPGMFLDAMEFWNEQSGIVIGDPIKGKFFVTRTFDGGESWQDIDYNRLPVADSGEACFAASGTNVRSLDRDEACFVSGGKRSRLFWKGQPIELPIVQGKEATGANSIAVRDRKKISNSLHFVVVGGDFTADTVSTMNCALTSDGGKTWSNPKTPPHGYRSCVEYISDDQLIACGTSGVDISDDGGKNWKLITKDGYHVCRKAKKGKAVFLAGSNGRIATLER